MTEQENDRIIDALDDLKREVEKYYTDCSLAIAEADTRCHHCNDSVFSSIVEMIQDRIKKLRDEELGMCKDCYWLRDHHFDEPRNPLEKNSKGKMYPCINIGVPGWNYWADNQKPPTECSEYCKKGEYVPAGIWADMANVIKEVDKHIKDAHVEPVRK